MYYGEEKKKEMMRSILPSRAPKFAKENKRSINRKLRREAKRSLRKIQCEEDWYEESLDFDWNYDGQKDRSWIVAVRRNADKLAHFEKWAMKKAKDVPDGEKMGYIKSILPSKGSLIYQHALDHLRFLPGFESNPYYYSWRLQYKRRTFDKEDLKEALKSICDKREVHIYFNDMIRRRACNVTWEILLREWFEYIKPYNSSIPKRMWEKVRLTQCSLKDKTPGPRILMGTYDIDDFIKDINYHAHTEKFVGDFKNPDYQPEWKLGVKLFVEDFIRDPDNHKKLKNYVPKSKAKAFCPKERKFVWKERERRYTYFKWKW